MVFRVIDGGKTPAQLGTAEYIWVDGVGDFHTKTRVIGVFPGEGGLVPRIETWTTLYESQELRLEPAYYLPHPFNPMPAFLVLCWVFHPDGAPHEMNTRFRLRQLVTHEKGRSFTQLGFKQGFTGSGSVADWKAAQDHLLRCIDAGIMIHSARICLEQRSWWYKIGRRADYDEGLGQNHPLTMCDHLLLSRYILEYASREADADLELGGPRGTLFFSTATLREEETALVVAADVARDLEEVPDVFIREGRLEIRGLHPIFDPYPITVRLMEALSEEIP